MQFYWLRAFGPITGDPGFARYGVGVEMSIKILVFTLDSFQERLMTKFFEKSKKPYFGLSVSF